MCKKCGCNTCETDGTALMLNESKAPRTILSEGLKHHIDANKPLTDNFYAAGSRDYFDLIAEARSLYSRGILEITNKRDIELLTETDQGYFGVYEGKKVPLDFPIAINEANKISDDKLMRLISKMPKGYVGKNTGTGKYTISTPDGKDIVLTQSKDKKNWSYEPSNVALKILNENERYEEKKIDILNKILNSLSVQRQDGEDREEDLEDLDVSIDQLTGALTGKNAAAIGFDQAAFGRFATLPDDSKKKVKEVVESLIDEAKFKGKTVQLNKPTRGDSKKFKVYVNSGKKNADGSIKVKKVNFGHGGTSAKRPTMRIRKSNPKRRKAFRARHRCDSPGPKTMARYWSCKKW